ncbi:MAG: hypothetical protein Q9220_005769 [cf. Caloplaca sp. 1 TL-2023]
MDSMSERQQRRQQYARRERQRRARQSTDNVFFQPTPDPAHWRPLPTSPQHPPDPNGYNAFVPNAHPRGQPPVPSYQEVQRQANIDMLGRTAHLMQQNLQQNAQRMFQTIVNATFAPTAVSNQAYGSFGSFWPGQMPQNPIPPAYAMPSEYAMPEASHQATPPVPTPRSPSTQSANHQDTAAPLAGTTWNQEFGFMGRSTGFVESEPGSPVLARSNITKNGPPSTEQDTLGDDKIDPIVQRFAAFSESRRKAGLLEADHLGTQQTQSASPSARKPSLLLQAVSNQDQLDDAKLVFVTPTANDTGLQPIESKVLLATERHSPALPPVGSLIGLNELTGRHAATSDAPLPPDAASMKVREPDSEAPGQMFHQPDNLLPAIEPNAQWQSPNASLADITAHATHLLSRHGNAQMLRGFFIDEISLNVFKDQECYSTDTFRLLKACTLIPEGYIMYVEGEPRDYVKVNEKPDTKHVIMVFFQNEEGTSVGHWLLVHVNFENKHMTCYDSLSKPSVVNFGPQHQKAFDRAREMINLYTPFQPPRAEFNKLLYRSIVQTDEYSCGPLAWREVEQIFAGQRLGNESVTVIRTRHCQQLVMTMDRYGLQSIELPDDHELVQLAGEAVQKASETTHIASITRQISPSSIPPAYIVYDEEIFQIPDESRGQASTRKRNTSIARSTSPSSPSAKHPRHHGFDEKTPQIPGVDAQQAPEKRGKDPTVESIDQSVDQPVDRPIKQSTQPNTSAKSISAPANRRVDSDTSAHAVPSRRSRRNVKRLNYAKLYYNEVLRSVEESIDMKTKEEDD